MGTLKQARGIVISDQSKGVPDTAEVYLLSSLVTIFEKPNSSDGY